MTITKLLLSAVVLIAVTAGVTAELVGAEGPARRDPQDPELMKKMMAYSTPGKEHALLTKAVGKWNNELTINYPGMPPQEMKYTGEIKSVIGGRFIDICDTFEFMGQKQEQRVTIGFNNHTKKYEICWLGSDGTAIIKGAGPATADGKGFEVSGSLVDPISPDGRKFKIIMKMKGDDVITTEAWDTIMGRFTKIVEGRATRVE